MPTTTLLTQEEADRFVAEWMEAWNSHDLDRILAHYDEAVEYHSPIIASLAVEGGPGADGRLIGKEAVAAYFAAALARNPDLHFDPPRQVAAGAGSVSFVYPSIRGLLAVETLVFTEDGQRVRRAYCHYTTG